MMHQFLLDPTYLFLQKLQQARSNVSSTLKLVCRSHKKCFTKKIEDQFANGDKSRNAAMIHKELCFFGGRKDKVTQYLFITALQFTTQHLGEKEKKENIGTFVFFFKQ